MSLMDHFHPPLSERRSWEGFHGLWASAMVEYLNDGVLADEFHADMHVHVGSAVEVDVATLEERIPLEHPPVATLAAPAWAPPATELVMDAVFPDEIEVQVLSTSAGLTLVAAIELLSPANKDRVQSRRAFVAKCANYLSQGIGVVIVDIVTNRHANLHNELMAYLNQPSRFNISSDDFTYAVAYRPSRSHDGDRIEVWPVPLSVGSSLPTLPLALRNAATVPLDLDATYLAACQHSRLR